MKLLLIVLLSLGLHAQTVVSGKVSLSGKVSFGPKLLHNNWVTTLSTGQNSIHGWIIADGFGWGVTITNPAQLVKINLNTGAVLGTIVWPSDNNHRNAGDIIYSSFNDRLYVIFETLTTPLIIVAEVNPQTLTTTDVISDTTSGFRNTFATPGSLATDGTSLYVTAENNIGNGFILKYAMSNFSFTASLSSGFGVPIHALRYDGTNIFITSNAAPGIMARVSPSTFTVSQTVTLSAGYGGITDDLAFQGLYMWVGIESSGTIGSGQIIRVLKTDLTSQTVVFDGLGFSNLGVYYDGTTFIWGVYGASAVTVGQIVQMNPTTLAYKVFRFANGQNMANEIWSDATNIYVTFNMSPAQICSVAIASIN